MIKVLMEDGLLSFPKGKELSAADWRRQAKSDSSDGSRAELHRAELRGTAPATPATRASSELHSARLEPSTALGLSPIGSMPELRLAGRPSTAPRPKRTASVSAPRESPSSEIVRQEAGGIRPDGFRQPLWRTSVAPLPRNDNRRQQLNRLAEALTILSANVKNDRAGIQEVVKEILVRLSYQERQASRPVWRALLHDRFPSETQQIAIAAIKQINFENKNPELKVFDQLDTLRSVEPAALQAINRVVGEIRNASTAANSEPISDTQQNVQQLSTTLVLAGFNKDLGYLAEEIVNRVGGNEAVIFKINGSEKDGVQRYAIEQLIKGLPGAEHVEFVSTLEQVELVTERFHSPKLHIVGFKQSESDRVEAARLKAMYAASEITKEVKVDLVSSAQEAGNLFGFSVTEVVLKLETAWRSELLNAMAA